jgi:hypothetical protein
MGFFNGILGSDPVPDFYFAAKGYVQVAITKDQAPHIDLHKLELGYANDLLEEGCTVEQALSARWGGVQAIHDDLTLFALAIRKGKEEAAEAGLLPESNNDAARAIHRKIFQCAGDFAVRCAWEADRKDYGRFLRHIGKRK